MRQNGTPQTTRKSGQKTAQLLSITCRMRQVMLVSCLMACWQPMAALAEAAPVAAQGTPAKVLIYIHPQEYTSGVKLWQYYRDYWFNQGPVVEPIVKQSLNDAFGDAAMCDQNQRTSNTLIWLRPKMFYNPQLMTYHANLVAVAYGAQGQPIATYEGHGQKIGFLDVQPLKNIEQTYRLAVAELIQKMQADSKFQENLNKGSSADTQNTPCALVTLLPAPKIQFMSFQ